MKSLGETVKEATLTALISVLSEIRDGKVVVQKPRKFEHKIYPSALRRLEKK